MMFLGRHGLGLFWGLGWMLGLGLFKLLFFGAMLALIVLALRARRHYPVQAQAGNAALDALNTRYARGEISKAEYDQIRHDIQ